MITAEVVQKLLVIDVVAMALLALVYLRQRRMNWTAYLCWATLAIGVPVLGPFLVIANRPGEWDPSFSIKNDITRLFVWARRLLPEPPPKKSRLDRARLRRQLRKEK